MMWTPKDLNLLNSIELYRAKMNSKEFQGVYPVLEPRYFRKLKNYLSHDKIMCNTSHLRGEDLEKSLRKTYPGKTVFLDTGVYQFYEKDLENNPINSRKERINRVIANLNPDLVSGFDVPSLIWNSVKEKKKRTKWSIDNYKEVKELTPENCRPVLGVSAFSEKSAKIVSQKVKKSLEESPKFIGLGGVVPLIKMPRKHPDLAKIPFKVLPIFRKEFPNSHIHVFGAGGKKWYPLVRYSGGDSADYAGYLSHAVHGKLLEVGEYPNEVSESDIKEMKRSKSLDDLSEKELLILRNLKVTVNQAEKVECSIKKDESFEKFQEHYEDVDILNEEIMNPLLN